MNGQAGMIPADEGQYNYYGNHYAPSDFVSPPTSPAPQQYGHPAPVQAAVGGTGNGGLPRYDHGPAPVIEPDRVPNEKPIGGPPIVYGVPLAAEGAIYGVPPQKASTICGIRKKLFWIIFGVILLLVAVGLGAGLGIVLSRKNNDSSTVIIPENDKNQSGLITNPPSTTHTTETQTSVVVVVQTSSQEPEPEPEPSPEPSPEEPSPSPSPSPSPTPEPEPEPEPETTPYIPETTLTTTPRRTTTPYVAPEPETTPYYPPTTTTTPRRTTTPYLPPDPTNFEMETGYQYVTVTVYSTEGAICEYFADYIYATTTIYPSVWGSSGDYTATWVLDQSYTYTATAYPTSTRGVESYIFEVDNTNPISGNCEFDGSHGIAFGDNYVAEFDMFITLEDTCTWNIFTYDAGEYCYVYFSGTWD